MSCAPGTGYPGILCSWCGRKCGRELCGHKCAPTARSDSNTDKLLSGRTPYSLCTGHSAGLRKSHSSASRSGRRDCMSTKCRGKPTCCTLDSLGRQIRHLMSTKTAKTTQKPINFPFRKVAPYSRTTHNWPES